MCNVGQPFKYSTLNQKERMVYVLSNKDFGDWGALILVNFEYKTVQYYDEGLKYKKYK